MVPVSRLRRALSVGALLVCLLGAATFRAAWSGDAELAASTRALEAGDPREAVVRARRAAGWYLPGAPRVTAAYERLAALGRAAETHRRDDIALLAWRGVRSAAIESRWLWTTHAPELDEANREIARLMAKVPNQAEPDAAIMQAQLQKLWRYEPPLAPWAIALCASFALAAVGLAMWSRAVGDTAGKLARGWLFDPSSRARLGAALTIAGVALWCLSLWQA